MVTLRLGEDTLPLPYNDIKPTESKAQSTLSVVCGTSTEHTLVKLEIKSVTDKISIWHGL